MHTIEQFDVRVRRLALLELSGWAIIQGPVGIDEGESMSDRLELLLGGAKFLKGMGLAAQGAGCARAWTKEPAGRRADC